MDHGKGPISATAGPIKEEPLTTPSDYPGKPPRDPEEVYASETVQEDSWVYGTDDHWADMDPSRDVYFIKTKLHPHFNGSNFPSSYTKNYDETVNTLNRNIFFNHERKIFLLRNGQLVNKLSARRVVCH